jgi:hemerythrin-like domain-containing protein
VSSQPDLYVGIHKGQRGKFFGIAMQAGVIDLADQASLDRLYDELSFFREHMKLHASLEEKFIHPLLSERVPGGARKLEEDHRKIDQQFDDIVTQFDAIRAKSIDFEKRSELVLEFYRAWNRFISLYFAHINDEEENVQPTLWKLCTNEELANTFRTILTSQKPDELKYNLEMMLPAMNLYERAEILNAGRASAPPEMFQAVLKLAERVLSPNDWTALKSKLGTK